MTKKELEIAATQQELAKKLNDLVMPLGDSANQSTVLRLKKLTTELLATFEVVDETEE